MDFFFSLDYRTQLSLPSGATGSMQNLTSSTSGSAVSTGMAQPNPLYQQPLNMQSTTPLVANGKDELRGWLYKWTNVGNMSTLHIRRN
jgi:hypothetical protein